MTISISKRMFDTILDEFSEPWPLLLVGVLGGGLLCFSILKPVVVSKERDLAIDTQLRKTVAGNFALENFYECRDSGAIFGRSPTTAGCINETTEAANTLRGTQFANEVREVLAKKFAATTK